MSLLFMDGFDHYSGSAEMLRAGYSAAIYGPTTSQLRRAGIGKSATSNGAYGFVYPMGERSSVIIGVAWYMEGGTSAVSSGNGIIVRDGATTQVVVAVLNTGAVVAGRGSTEIGRSAVGLVSYYTWHYFEVKVVISDTVGEVHVRLNGTLVLSLTGVDTKSTSNAYGDKLEFTASSGVVYWDDLYVIDPSVGSAPYNDFLGPVFIDTVYPDADGYYEQWDLSAGSDSYALVDDPGDMDDDTTYVYTTVHKEKDTFSLGALPSTGAAGNPLAVNLKVAARKDVASPPIKIRPMARLGSTDYIDTVHQNLAESYLVKNKIWELNPADSQPWEATDIDNGEFGFEMLRSTTTV